MTDASPPALMITRTWPIASVRAGAFVGGFDQWSSDYNYAEFQPHLTAWILGREYPEATIQQGAAVFIGLPRFGDDFAKLEFVGETSTTTMTRQWIPPQAGGGIALSLYVSQWSSDFDRDQFHPLPPDGYTLVRDWKPPVTHQGVNVNVVIRRWSDDFALTEFLPSAPFEIVRTYPAAKMTITAHPVPWVSIKHWGEFHPGNILSVTTQRRTRTWKPFTLPKPAGVTLTPGVIIREWKPGYKVRIGVRQDVATKEFIREWGAFAAFAFKIVGTGTGVVPLAHMEDANKLQADAKVELFQITLADGQTTIYLKNNNTVTWRGHEYRGTGIQLTGVAQFASEEKARPKLQIINPEGVYSSLVDKGSLNAATIVRIRVLKADLDRDLPVFTRQQWKVSRTETLTNQYISLELRDQLDGQFFQVPGRMYIAPEFPQVSLS